MDVRWTSKQRCLLTAISPSRVVFNRSNFFFSRISLYINNRYNYVYLWMGRIVDSCWPALWSVYVLFLQTFFSNSSRLQYYSKLVSCYTAESFYSGHHQYKDFCLSYREISPLHGDHFLIGFSLHQLIPSKDNCVCLMELSAICVYINQFFS